MENETMQAAYLPRRGGAEDLRYGTVPRPVPATGDVLVQVYAATVMPTEPGWRETWETEAGVPLPVPRILGHEFSGRVAALGAGVRDLAVGDAVYGMNDWTRPGAQAEYCLTRPEQIAARPATAGDAEAAVTPISALTAWQALVVHGNLSAGQRVLIHGGAGSVGSFAVQLAHSLGAQVIATAAAASGEFVRGLGADEVIDYARTPFESAVRDVDLVLDTIGGETQARSWATLRPGGLLVSVVHPPDPAQASAHGVQGVFFIVAADAAQLRAIAQMIDNHELRPLVAATFPLAEARAAFAFAAHGGQRGKTVLRVAGGQQAAPGPATAH